MSRNHTALPVALELLARAANIVLEAGGYPQRVSANIAVTSRDGWTFIAFEEMRPGDVPPPIDTTHLRRDPARGG